MKARLQRPDGTVLELDGTEAEVLRALAAQGPPQVQFLPLPCARPHADAGPHSGGWWGIYPPGGWTYSTGGTALIDAP